MSDDNIIPPSNLEDYYKSNFHNSKMSPKTMWVIHDPVNGPQIRFNKRDIEKLYKQLKTDHLYDKNEEFEKLSKPQKYILDNSQNRYKEIRKEKGDIS